MVDGKYIYLIHRSPAKRWIIQVVSVPELLPSARRPERVVAGVLSAYGRGARIGW